MSGTTVIITDKNVRVVPYITFGLIFVAIGSIIYVVLPKALLAENASLILQIFFAILVGMILGLTLLTANLRGPIETFMVYLMFFWEKKSMRALLKKNLVAHKNTNKLTSIIYALTLGCVIFLVVSLNLVLESITSLNWVEGTDIKMHVGDWWTNFNRMNATEFDPVLRQYSDSIESFGLMSSISPRVTQNGAF